MQREIKPHSALFGKWTIFVFFTAVYALISLVNHYTFKTYAWDLGINNNAIWDYSHFRWNNCMLIDGPQFENVLSDHLTLYPIFISPLIHFFGTYTMLVFQILAILFGGLGVYRCTFLKTENFILSNIALISFFSMWGVFSALGFDYHDNVVSAMFVPWIYYFLLKEKIVPMLLITLVMMIGKENMALWTVFIGAGLFLRYLKDPVKRKMALFVSCIAIVYFYLAVNVIIPSFSNAGRGYLHFNYAALGLNFKEAFIRLVTDPIYVMKLLWVNHTGEMDAIGIKTELHFVFFLSGGILLLFRPVWMVMLIPIYAQKLFNDDFTKWGINSHYSIEFAPILALGAFDVIGGFQKTDKFKIWLGTLVTILTLLITISKMDTRVSKWYIKENVAFYDKSHYIKEFDIPAVHEALKLIPDTASVAASEVLVPHLAFRETIYLYPLGKEPSYIALLDHDRTFPLNRQRIREEIRKLTADTTWRTVYAKNQLYIFKKN
ncbi:MAG: DUF2079 domain-containing protein [Bacteroidetes bacterium]|nr:DUF2079 domain-containing protein [Bacteroidota bacterium]